MTEERGYRCGPQTWVLSDPRLSGSATSTWNADVYSFGGDTVSVRAGAYDVENDAGTWRCTFSGHLAHESGLLPESVNDETASLRRERRVRGPHGDPVNRPYDHPVPDGRHHRAGCRATRPLIDGLRPALCPSQ